MNHVIAQGSPGSLIREFQDHPARAVALLVALEWYVDWHGSCHDDDCPGDDTCDCDGRHINDAVNSAIAAIRKDHPKRTDVRHGFDCPKVPHKGTGHLHSENDDTPYDVDGVQYCGRCHVHLDRNL